MVSASRCNVAFMNSTLSDRMQSAMQEAGVSPKELADACGVRVQAVYQWRSGAIKKLEGMNLVKAAARLGVRSQWLGEGRGPRRGDDGAQNLTDGPVIRGEVPLISWVQAGNAAQIVDNYQPGQGERMVPVTVPVKQHTYALRVKGDSMTDPSGNGPSFPEGTIIVVEPDMEARHRSFVVVKTAGEEEGNFKQLIIDGGDMYLKPLNPDYKTKPFPEGGRISGVVRQAIQILE